MGRHQGGTINSHAHAGVLVNDDPPIGKHGHGQDILGPCLPAFGPLGMDYVNPRRTLSLHHWMPVNGLDCVQFRSETKACRVAIVGQTKATGATDFVSDPQSTAESAHIKCGQDTTAAIAGTGSTLSQCI